MSEHNMWEIEQSYYEQGITCICGVDEAGRGPLAGPVCAAAVILPANLEIPGLNDSKKLSDKRRRELYPVIIEQAVAYGIGLADHKEIDEINILRASILAMHRALDGLSLRPDFIIVDGNRFTPYGRTPHATIVKGDARYLSIAAASILAKTYRDDEMHRLAALYPGYGWERNAGYPTAAHREAIARLGVTPFHRRTFKLVKEG